MAGRLLAGVAVGEIEPAMEGARLDHRLPRNGRVVGEDGGHKRASAAIGKRQRMAEVAIGHDGGDRSEGLDRVDAHRTIGIGAVEQHRRHEGAVLGVRALDAQSCRVAEHAPRLGGDEGRLVVARRRAGRGSPARPCGSSRCADRRPRSWPAAPRSPRSRRPCALAGTMMRRIAVHFWPALAVISRCTSRTKRVEFRRAGRGIGAEDRGVERILLGHEAHRVFQQVAVGAQHQRRRCRAGEGDHVLTIQPVEQVAGAAGHELDRALREDLRLRSSCGSRLPSARRSPRPA